MSTLLYSTSFLDGPGLIERHLRYLKYYRSIKEQIGFDDIYFLNNGPIYTGDIIRVDVQPRITFFDVQTHSAPLLTDSEFCAYPYCWRGIYWMRYLFDMGWDKIIFCDTDGFILSKRLMEYVKNCNSGWIAFKEEKYSWPTSEFHIINKDAQPILERFCAEMSYMARGNKEMEAVLPFTHVETGFKVRRAGEDRLPIDGYDFYGQCPNDMEIKCEI